MAGIPPNDHHRAENGSKPKTVPGTVQRSDHPEVPPTNNLAEQALRPLVVLRKLTFGSRSRAGAERLANLLTVVETAKRHGHDVLAFLYKLLSRSPGRMLRFLYDKRLYGG